MLPLLLAAGVGAGLSLAGDHERNKKIASTAQMNLRFAEREAAHRLGLDYAQAAEGAEDINNALGLKAADRQLEGEKQEGEVAAKFAERDAYGVSAARAIARQKIDTSIDIDNIEQSAYAARVSLENRVVASKVAYDSNIQQAVMQQRNTMAKKASNLEMFSNALGSGASMAGAVSGFL